MKHYSVFGVALASVVISCFATAVQVGASVIDFADQPAGTGGFDPTVTAQTLVYDISGVTVTFTGGVILTNENGAPIDQNNIYATASFGNASLTNPLTITFSKPVENLAVTIVNGLAGDYFLSDNAGHSTSFSLPTQSSSEATGELADPGTVVQAGFSGPGIPGATFDFALGQISFDIPAPPAVPEPSTAMLGCGLFALAVAHFRRHLG